MPETQRTQIETLPDGREMVKIRPTGIDVVGETTTVIRYEVANENGDPEERAVVLPGPPEMYFPQFDTGSAEGARTMFGLGKGTRRKTVRVLSGLGYAAAMAACGNIDNGTPDGDGGIGQIHAAMTAAQVDAISTPQGSIPGIPTGSREPQATTWEGRQIITWTHPSDSYAINYLDCSDFADEIECAQTGVIGEPDSIQGLRTDVGGYGTGGICKVGGQDKFIFSAGGNPIAQYDVFINADGKFEVAPGSFEQISPELNTGAHMSLLCNGVDDPRLVAQSIPVKVRNLVTGTDEILTDINPTWVGQCGTPTQDGDGEAIGSHPISGDCTLVRAPTLEELLNNIIATHDITGVSFRNPRILGNILIYQKYPTGSLNSTQLWYAVVPPIEPPTDAGTTPDIGADTTTTTPDAGTTPDLSSDATTTTLDGGITPADLGPDATIPDPDAGTDPFTCTFPNGSRVEMTDGCDLTCGDTNATVEGTCSADIYPPESETAVHAELTGAAYSIGTIQFLGELLNSGRVRITDNGHNWPTQYAEFTIAVAGTIYSIEVNPTEGIVTIGCEEGRIQISFDGTVIYTLDAGETGVYDAETGEPAEGEAEAESEAEAEGEEGEAEAESEAEAEGEEGEAEAEAESEGETSPGCGGCNVGGKAPEKTHDLTFLAAILLAVAATARKKAERRSAAKHPVRAAILQTFRSVVGKGGMVFRKR